MKHKTNPVPGDIVKIVGLDDPYLIVDGASYVVEDPVNGSFVSVYQIGGVPLSVVQLAELLAPPSPATRTLVNADKVKSFWIKGGGRMHGKGMPLSLDDITFLGRCRFVKKHVSVTHEVVGQVHVENEDTVPQFAEAR